MLRIVVTCLLASVQGQRHAWTTRTESWGQHSPSKQAHVSLGRLPLSTCHENFHTRDLENGDSTNCDLDTSQWLASSEILSEDDIVNSSEAPNRAGRRGQQQSRNINTLELASLRTRVRIRHKVVEEEDTQVNTDSDQNVLQGVTMPVVPTHIWNRLTGHEFDNPSTVAELARTGLRLASQSANAWVEWKPVGRNNVELPEKLEEALSDGSILVYLGKCLIEGHGSNLPMIKTFSIIDMSPKDMAELLLDSSRVKTYNKMSVGRKDVRVMQQGVDTQGPFGEGETKVVRNLTQPPLVKKKMLSVTMMHGRRLHPDDGISTGGYLVVSRAVPDRSEETESFGKSEILLGVNVLQCLNDPDQCLVTSVTHVYAPSLPAMMASKVGVNSSINFVKDIRSVCQPRSKVLVKST